MKIQYGDDIRLPERIDHARARIEVAMQEIDAIYHQDGNYAVLVNADRVVDEIRKS